MNSPLDADAVVRDDALLDALSRGELPAEFSDDPTARLLLAWRDDIVDSPVEVVAELAEVTPFERLRAGRYLRFSRRVTVAAAVGVFAAGSLGSVAAASMAEPGSPLWPITQVVYTERAQSLEARDDALSTLRKARDAAQQHRPEQAQHLLDMARQQAGKVRESDDRDAITDEVAEVQQVLEEALAAPPVTQTPPPPPVVAPDPTPPSSPAPDPSPAQTSAPDPVPSVQPSPASPEPEPSTPTATPLASPPAESPQTLDTPPPTN